MVYTRVYDTKSADTRSADTRSAALQRVDTRSGNFPRVDTTSARSDQDLLIIENRSTVVKCSHSDRPVCVPGTLYRVSSQTSLDGNRAVHDRIKQIPC